MREALALLRANWLTAASYRVGLVMSLAALLITVVPVYFVAGALQPVVDESIRNEGSHYFGFLLLGIAATYLVGAAVNSLSQSMANGIRSGTLEALFCTPAPVPRILAGLTGFDFTWAALRALLLLVILSTVGPGVYWLQLPVAAGAALLTTIAYLAIGLVAAALILVFRTAGPLNQGVLAASMLLGGVYYSTSVIPEPLAPLAAAVPLTYGLRMARRSLLENSPVTALAGDALVLTGLALAFAAVGIAAFALALRHARRHGTLGQY